LIGIHDNFFELGGTSILAIKITAALHKQGIDIKVSDLFQYPTIARIAPYANQLHRDTHQGEMTGRVPLTPHQLWALAANGGRTRGRAFWVTAGVRLAPRELEAAIIRLREHHDALRLKPSHEILSLVHETSSTTSHFGEIDFRGSAQARADLDELVARSLSSLDFQFGLMMSVTLVHLPEGDGLLISALDILFDDHSLTVLIADLTRLYSQHASREFPSLPPKTEPFKVWAEGCTGLVDGDLSCIEPLLRDSGHAGTSSPLDHDNRQPPLSEAEGMLSEEQTRVLFGKANDAFNTDPADLVLAGLAMAVTTLFGGDQVSVVMDEDGRPYLFPQLDVSRTVGCFRNLYAVPLEPANSSDVSSAIIRAKEGVRRAREAAQNDVFGLLDRSVSAWSTSPLLIEFRFQTSRPAAPDGWSVFQLEAHTAVRNGMGKSSRRLKLTADVRDDRLRLTVKYRSDYHQQPLMQSLISESMAAICKIVEHCESKERPEPTPSDFTYKGLSIDAMNNLFD